MKAELSPRRVHQLSIVLIGTISVWLARHIYYAVKTGSLQYVYENWVLLFSFVMLCITLLLAYREKPKAAPLSATASEYVTAVVPAYNEDPEVLRGCLRSLLTQTRPFQEICVTDDGSNRADYTELKQWAEAFGSLQNVTVRWHRQPNKGKREAQSVWFRNSPDTTIFVTVDSDSIMDSKALEELLKPFADPDVQSAAGVVLALNNRTNLLARITDLLFVTGQLTDRSMMSSMNSVLVNSGGLAAYRAQNIRDNLDAYLHESFFGHHITFSDDSMLTLYSLNNGKTVQQPTAFVFAMMPDKFSHHYRQQLRWMKGSFIRSWWRIKYLPVNSFAFFRQVVGWSQFVITTMLLTLFFIIKPVTSHAFSPYLILVPFILGYVQALRYFAVQRSDESKWSQFATFALAPLAILWSYFIIRPIRIYAAFTCFKGQWGTRQNVEVSLDGATRRSWRAALADPFVFETYYERLARRIAAEAADQAEAERRWLHRYGALPMRKQRKIWSGYERVVKRSIDQAEGTNWHVLHVPLTVG